MSDENFVILVVGGRRRGKTDYVKEFIILPSAQPKKLIVDRIDSENWRTMQTYLHPENAGVPIPDIPLENIGRWESGIGRIYRSDLTPVFAAITADLWNAVIILEDATRFIDRTRASSKVMDFIWDCKQRNNHVVLNFHSLKSIPSNLLEAVDFMTIFKTQEGECPEKLTFNNRIPEAVKFVRDSSDWHFHTTIDVRL